MPILPLCSPVLLRRASPAQERAQEILMPSSTHLSQRSWWTPPTTTASLWQIPLAGGGWMPFVVSCVVGIPLPASLGFIFSATTFPPHRRFHFYFILHLAVLWAKPTMVLK